MSNSLRQLVGALTALVVIICMSLLTVPTAFAEYPLAQDSDGECAVKVHNAHASSHNPGASNVVAAMSCKSVKPHISGIVWLERASDAGGWELVGRGDGGKDNVGQLALNAAWGQCINGIQMRGRARFNYTTDGKNTLSVEAIGPISTIQRCP